MPEADTTPTATSTRVRREPARGGGGEVASSRARIGDRAFSSTRGQSGRRRRACKGCGRHGWRSVGPAWTRCRRGRGDGGDGVTPGGSDTRAGPGRLRPCRAVERLAWRGSVLSLHLGPSYQQHEDAPNQGRRQRILYVLRDPV